MKKIINISIGIPAYNEEKNIKKLISSLLNQKSNNFVIKEIIVVSDNSTDNTIKELQSIRDERVLLLKNNERLGQAYGQNSIVKKFKGDILVLLNADVLPANKYFISELIKPFGKDKKIAIFVPKTKPVEASNIFERIINFSVDFKDTMSESWKNGDNLYQCKGAGRALSREFAKKIFWNDSLSEDAYTYLFCKKYGYKFNFNPNSTLYFKSPDNFKDHNLQSARFVYGPNIMSNYFDRRIVQREYSIPKRIIVSVLLRFFIKNPFYLSSYIVILLLVKLNPSIYKLVKSNWQISKSSKTLKTI